MNTLINNGPASLAKHLDGGHPGVARTPRRLRLLAFPMLLGAAVLAGGCSTSCQLPRVVSHLTATVTDASQVDGATSAKACEGSGSCDVVDYAPNQKTVAFTIGNAATDVPSTVNLTIQFLDAAGKTVWSKNFDALPVTVSQTGGDCSQSFWTAQVDL